MTKDQLVRLLQRLPEDASELSIPAHNSSELIFNSDLLTKENAPQINALPAQRGTYSGLKKRWRIKDDFQQSMIQPHKPDDKYDGTPINLSDIPRAE